MTPFYATVARFYDAENRDKTDDLALYSQLAAEYGDPIIDIGCGTGRVMFHLAEAGYEIHGIDNEGAMLDRARQRLAEKSHLQDKLTFYQGDVLQYDIPHRFKLVLVPYNGLMHFHEQDTQIALLCRLRALTDEGGLLVIDLPNAGEAFATEDSDALTLERTFVDPETGHLILLQSTNYIDRITQMMRVTWLYDEVTADGTVKRTYVPHLLRYYFYPELCLLLGQTGFTVETVYGHPDGSPFEDGCERMIVLARPV